MSHDNADAVRAIYARFREGDFRSSVGVLDPRVVFMPLADSPEAELCFGAEALAAWMRGLFESFRNVTMEALEFTASGDTVMVDVRQRGLARVSGVPSDTRYYTLWSFRGRKVIRIETFQDRAAAAEAAGLQDESGSSP